MIDNWLTVAQAARELGISERQARRYAARLAPEDREEAPDMTPDAEPDRSDTKAGHERATRPARRPARVRFTAMKAAREGATQRENLQLTLKNEAATSDTGAGHAPDMAAQEPDVAPDIMPKRAGHTPDSLTDWQERAAEYKEQIQFLRATVEQHQRSEAELRAALREALKAHPRQLTSGEPPSTKTEALIPARQNVSMSVAPTKTPRETRQTQRHRAVREFIKAFFGIDNEKE